MSKQNQDKSITLREKVLNAAKEVVLKDRNLDYGNSEDNFSDIGRMYTIYKENNRPGEHNSVDVAVFGIIIKLCRIKQSPTKLDHSIDIAGYAACLAECADKEYKNKIKNVLKK